MGARGERIRGLSLAAIIGLVVVAGACKPLREYPAAKAMTFGTAARADLLAEPEYAAVLAREFGALVPENELKWITIHPQQTTYNFGPADRLVNFAEDHDMAVRGVPLLWHEQNPAWLTGGNFTRAQTRAIVADHIARVVGRYRGRIRQWDVVNEPFTATGSLENSVFRKGGSEYIDEAFAMARAADPSAKLFLNEFEIETPGTKADAVFTWVANAKARGVPIDGIGFQMHRDTTRPTPAQLASQMARYASIGVEVAITELDVKLGMPASAQAIQNQAQAFRDVLATCRAASNCKTFMMWGFTDKYSWIPVFFPGWGAATIHDAQYGKKPAYDALLDNLANG